MTSRASAALAKEEPRYYPGFVHGGAGYTVVTPEAVGLDLSTASVVSRSMARVIDIAACLGGYVVIAIISLLASLIIGSSIPTVAQLVASFAVVLVYPVVSEAFFRGRTLGKLALGLRVITVEGSPVGLREAVARGALGLFDVWATLGSLGIITMVLSKQDQRLGDMVAGTLVVRERRAQAEAPARFIVPPGLEQFALGLDISVVTPADYEVVRSFLVRWANFKSWDRQMLAAGIAGPLWQRSRQPVPVNLGPDIYLACLGWAYQMRHHGGALDHRGAVVRPPAPASAWAPRLPSPAGPSRPSEPGIPNPWAPPEGLPGPGGAAPTSPHPWAPPR